MEPCDRHAPHGTRLVNGYGCRTCPSAPTCNRCGIGLDWLGCWCHWKYKYRIEAVECVGKVACNPEADSHRKASHKTSAQEHQFDTIRSPALGDHTSDGWPVRLCVGQSLRHTHSVKRRTLSFWWPSPRISNYIPQDPTRLDNLWR